MTLPPFNAQGLLPVGEYACTYNELLASHLITGAHSKSPGTWDEQRRTVLLNNFMYLAQQLWACGAEDIVIYGSFIDDNPCPRDVDAYFTHPNVKELRNGTFRRQLNTMETRQLWDWLNKVPHPDKDKPQMKIWHTYRVEFLPVAEGMKNHFDIDGALFPVPTGAHIARNNHIKGVVKMLKPTQPIEITPVVFDVLDDVPGQS